MDPDPHHFGTVTWIRRAFIWKLGWIRFRIRIRVKNRIGIRRGVPRGDAQDARASPLPRPVHPPLAMCIPPPPQPERLVMRKDEEVFLYYIH